MRLRTRIPHIRLHEPRIHDKRRNARMLKVNATHEVVRQSFGGAVHAQGIHRTTLHSTSATQRTSDGDELWVGGLVQQGDGGLEEGEWAVCVGLNVVGEIFELDLGDWAGGLAYACVGNDDVQGFDAVVLSERLCELGGVELGAIEGEDDELAVGARGEGGETFGCRVRGIAHCGDDGYVVSRQVLLDCSTAEAAVCAGDEVGGGHGEVQGRLLDGQ